MNKAITLLLIIFLAFPCIAFSITTFTILETEKISLQADASDPDADNLTMTYAHPLNEKGEWQTSYGDAGEYKSTISVSDGTTADSREILIIVNKKEEAPKIESFAPKQDILDIKEAESISFRVSAADLNKDELRYEWFLDDEKKLEGQEFIYSADYSSAGKHKIRAEISDGTLAVMQEWSVNVENVDVEGILEAIQDISVNENDAARLKLPDFEKYGLAYTISEPIGNDNEWKTGFKDAGTYEARLHAEGKGFSGDKIVKIAVNDVDRAPVFEKIGNKFVNENEEVKITLNAQDPDGDEITYSAGNLPEGSQFEGNAFTWKTSYGTVRKEGFVDNVMDKLRVLSKSFHLQFIASSRDKKIVQNIIITVKDINLAPILEDIEPININEGETARIAAKAYDPDGDKVKLSYSGFMDSDTFKSEFDDAGTYYTKVTASDGLLETAKFARINIKQSNRQPIFSKIQGIKTREGDSVAVLLNANDPDGDEITYSIDNPPKGSSIRGNVFLWTPGYDTANKKETKKLDIAFAASDGKAEARQVLKIEVADKNRIPRITDATKSISAKVNEPVLMFVKAADDDGDELTYTWSFGLIEKYKATAYHQRIFKSRGIKTVKVVVSDGTDEVEQLISVNVV
jgi:hypothetical protein